MKATHLRIIANRPVTDRERPLYQKLVHPDDRVRLGSAECSFYDRELKAAWDEIRIDAELGVVWLLGKAFGMVTLFTVATYAGYWVIGEVFA